MSETPRETCDECGRFATELFYVESVNGAGHTAGSDGMVCLSCRRKYDTQPETAHAR